MESKFDYGACTYFPFHQKFPQMKQSEHGEGLVSYSQIPSLVVSNENIANSPNKIKAARKTTPYIYK